MSGIGWYDSRTRSTGKNVKIKTAANTDYDIINKYNQFDTAVVIQVLRNEKDIGTNSKSGNIASDIGAILCKPINKNSAGYIKAYPLNVNIIQYPAEGEYVKVGSLGGDSEKVFYELITTSGLVNYNGNTSRLALETKNNSNITLRDGETLVSTSSTFKIRNQVKLNPLSSDLILQSRFGSNIRMTDMTPNSDSNISPTMILSNNIAPGFNTSIEENINNQGSYIILTSGPSHFEFFPTVYRDFVNSNQIRKSPTAFESSTTYREYSHVNRANGGWIQDKFEIGTYAFKPDFTGDRIILSSDEIINQSTSGDSYYLSNKNIVMFSNYATSIDALRGMDINTNKASFRLKSNNTYINSPNIYLGMEEDRSQPALLGENLLVFLELIIGALKKYLDLSSIFDGAVYDAPGQSESAENLRNMLNELLVTGRIPEDLRRNLLSDKVFIGSNRVDPQIDSPPTQKTEQ